MRGKPGFWIGWMLTLGLLLTLAGCRGSGGTMAYKQGEEPAVGKAGRTGYYELRIADSKGDALYKYHVERGAPLGFRRTSDRRLEAVAGDYAFTLRGDTDYEWEYSGQQGAR